MSHSFVVDGSLKREHTDFLRAVPLAESISSMLGLVSPEWIKDKVISKPIEACGSTAPNVLFTNTNPLMAAIDIAYSRHVPLTISPDDVWLTIANSFAIHINNDPEKYRKRFVKHDGQLVLDVRRDSFVKGSPDNDWMGAFKEFSAKIKEHIGKKHDLLVSDFTTTGPVERAASELIMMNTVQAYFVYSMHTCCGLKEVTVRGEPKDWQNMYQRVEALAEFDIEWWTKHLLPTVLQFAIAAAGKPDLEWWKNFYKLNGMSGGPYISGFINTLFPYLLSSGGEFKKKNEYMELSKNDRRWATGPGSDDYPMGIARTPFIWYYYARRFAMEFIGGHVGVKFDEGSGAVEPAIGWAIRELDQVPEKLKTLMESPVEVSAT